MFKKFKIVFAALTLSVATLAAGTGAASAGDLSLEFRFGGHHKPHFRIQPYPYYGAPHYERGYSHRGVCKPRKAVRKARHAFGLHKVKVQRVNHRKVVVRGYRHGHRVKVVFANQRGCPVIAQRIRHR